MFCSAGTPCKRPASEALLAAAATNGCPGTPPCLPRSAPAPGRCHQEMPPCVSDILLLGDNNSSARQRAIRRPSSEKAHGHQLKGSQQLHSRCLASSP